MRRFLQFGVVGATGAAVETTVLAALTAAGAPLLAAKLLGTEAGILNNFFWNDRWTFRKGRGATGRALLRQRPDFHPAGGGGEGRAVREAAARPPDAARGQGDWGGAAAPPYRDGTGAGWRRLGRFHLAALGGLAVNLAVFWSLARGLHCEDAPVSWTRKGRSAWGS